MEHRTYIAVDERGTRDPHDYWSLTMLIESTLTVQLRVRFSKIHKNASLACAVPWLRESDAPDQILKAMVRT